MFTQDRWENWDKYTGMNPWTYCTNGDVQNEKRQVVDSSYTGHCVQNEKDSDKYASDSHSNYFSRREVIITPRLSHAKWKACVKCDVMKIHSQQKQSRNNWFEFLEIYEMKVFLLFVHLFKFYLNSMGLIWNFHKFCNALLSHNLQIFPYSVFLCFIFSNFLNLNVWNPAIYF